MWAMVMIAIYALVSALKTQKIKKYIRLYFSFTKFLNISLTNWFNNQTIPIAYFNARKIKDPKSHNYWNEKKLS